MTLEQAAELTGGEIHGRNVSFSAVSTDTRTLQPDELFLALSGDNFDGNDYVGVAQQQQAVAALVSRLQGATLPQLVVADTLEALGQLGAFNRQSSQACVIGVTGSQGKTTVKEMLATILAHRHEVLVTRGNLNNAIGVPLTLLKIGPEHSFAVIEMGANAIGEIAYVAELARPKIAHITNVAGTHLEGFGSLEGVASGKSEIWDSLPDDGVAVINLDDRFAPQWRQQNRDRRCVLVSAEGQATADYAICEREQKSDGSSRILMRTPQGMVWAELVLLGRHNQANALAASAMALEAGATLTDVQAGLSAMKPVPGRMVPLLLSSGALLIDDTYNASPASFRMAIDVLGARSGEKILVCGDMGELGPEAEVLHRKTGEYAASAGIDQLLATGELSKQTVAGFGESAEHYASQEKLLTALLEKLGRGKTVLVKGSRSAGLDKLTKKLREKEA